MYIILADRRGYAACGLCPLFLWLKCIYNSFVIEYGSYHIVVCDTRRINGYG